MESSRRVSRPGRTLAPLPVELKHLILRFCDVPTLAVSSRVSLAFLELSAPLLYQDIELIGLDKVEQLLCHREEASPPSHLTPLNLTHIRSLTIVATYNTGGDLSLSTSRLVSPTLTLPVDLLVLRPIGINPCDTDDQECEIERWTEVLKIIDPVHVRLSGLPPGQFNKDQIPRIDIFYSAWPKLESLVVSNIDFNGFLGDSLLVQEVEGADVIVSLDLSERVGGDAYMDRLRFDTSFELHPEAFLGPLGRIKKIVVRLQDNEEKEKFERDMLSFWSREGAERVEAFRKHIRFEVVSAIVPGVSGT